MLSGIKTFLAKKPATPKMTRAMSSLIKWELYFDLDSVGTYDLLKMIWFRRVKTPTPDKQGQSLHEIHFKIRKEFLRY